MIAKQEDHSLEDTLHLNAMNTSFYIRVKDCQRKEWKNVISAWILYVEKEWSRFRTDNELYRLNELKAGEQMIVTSPLFDVLQKAEAYRQNTNGLFSPYLLPQMQFHGYEQTFPFTATIQQEHSLPCIFNDINAPFEFLQNTGSVKRTAAGKIDLGGIGKGYAVQSAARWLKEIGQARAGIVDGGGDITVWSDGEEKWKIGVAHPFKKEQEIAQFRLKNGSVATSNTIYRSWLQGNEQKHHILNGRTGLPVESPIIQATVFSENCLDAEVAAKLCFMVNPFEWKKITNTYKLLLVDQDGKITSFKRNEV
ncbi:FAD:protein FMN transferase [Bacillus sp. EB600]|uniref:FAD:protein FMN transferase n=1 Tax=Bacillus sp. EB600 TaxID=2806345 RepID=UPI00210B27CE|nr:FAD:protein FMN transferase [Bacillus sp. EB600]